MLLVLVLPIDKLTEKFNFWFKHKLLKQKEDKIQYENAVKIKWLITFVPMLAVGYVNCLE